MSADIFISFASKDVKVALTLCSAIENRGFKCWISARDIQPGDNFQVSIVQALRSAKVLLLVFTANSNTSEEMTKELALASQRKMIVIPLRAEDVAPNDAFAYEFATRQWIDAFADWEFSIEQLCRRLEHALAAPEIEEAPSRAEPVAVETAPVVEAAPPVKAKKAPAEPRPAPAAADNDEVEGLRRSGLGRLAAAAVFVAVLAGLGLAASALMNSKPAPAAASVPAAAPEAALATPAPAPIQAVAALPDPAASVAANEIVAAAEPVKPAAPKRKVARAPARAAAATEIPY
jgi:hypothetical protein